MKIDELINLLEQKKEEHGNIEVETTKHAQEGDRVVQWESKIKEEDIIHTTVDTLKIL